MDIQYFSYPDWSSSSKDVALQQVYKHLYTVTSIAFCL